VRRSLPLPPIPGRDPLPGDDEPTTVTRLPRAPMSPGRRRLARVAIALVTLLGLVVVSYVGLYVYGDRALDRVDALVPDGPEVLAPQLQKSSQTYLLVGTDLPGRSGQAAVSTLIAHVSADGDQAVLVSVPPTALNDTPTCRDDNGEVRPAATESFATALLDGGPSCLVRSVQQLTGLRIDHYVAVDAAQLPGLVDAVGDVAVCLPTGSGRLAGDGVSAYLGPDDGGSDVTGAAATERGQQVLTSALQSGLTGGALADPLTLIRFLSRAGDAVTVDADSTLGDLRTLGTTLGDLHGDALQRTELPVAQLGYVPTGSDQAAVVVDATATRELFDAVIDSGRLPAPAAADPAVPTTTDSAAGAAAADSLPDPALTDPVPAGTLVTVAPNAITLDVLDATGGSRAGEVADGLAGAGFVIGARGAEPAAVGRTEVRYGPASLEPARTVAAAVPGAVLEQTDAVGEHVQLVVGPDFTGLSPVAVGTAVPTTAAPAPVETGTGAATNCG
jgi:LCP family protein required for cell wall assembly